ncbi:hypothetical protein [Burkholderia sp. Ac-20365]|uniref:hypothetical protein n=1 Tax=Burkholderia sp. Ac-20365 TaxID=2703897 RepID=UPI00197C3673|nr:hypothetical protein [Burkholderia sp. Ac-20365]MBN3761216.1 hypothetical protein [Burkholderia sp. Ac-20365]
MTKKIPATALCPELAAVVERELASGNRLKDGPIQTDWPEPGSIFAALVSELCRESSPLPDSVRHSICRDPHFGWHDECYCTIHRHLLVAGDTRLS